MWCFSNVRWAIIDSVALSTYIYSVMQSIFSFLCRRKSEYVLTSLVSRKNPFLNGKNTNREVISTILTTQHTFLVPINKEFYGIQKLTISIWKIKHNEYLLISQTFLIYNSGNFVDNGPHTLSSKETTRKLPRLLFTNS